MYKIFFNDEILLQAESPRWVKVNPSSGAWIQCDFDDAQCVAVDCKRYSIEGRPPVDDAPVVKVKFVDHVQTVNDVDLLFFALGNVIHDILNDR